MTIDASHSDRPNRRFVAANLTDLHAEPSFISELLTQVLNGRELEVLKEEGDWCFVRQTDGYLGWAYASYLTAATPEPATHLITAPASRLYAAPAVEPVPLTCLLAGTAVHVRDQSGDWARIIPAGDKLSSGWMPLSDLRSIKDLPLSIDAARRQMIADARKLTGVYYLWGGASSFGLDCSALAQLVHRLSGYTLPRDASMQFPLGRPVEPPFEPGDLLFFHGESNKQKITHVGISLGGWRIVHSSRKHNGVYEEDVQAADRLKNTFAGARTFLIQR